MTNPFDLRGPDFLVFYACLAAGVVCVARWVVRRMEPEPGSSGLLPPLRDPYEIACLRGGPRLLLEVALLSLIDRRLLEVSGAEVQAAPEAEGRVTRPLDLTILRRFSLSGRPAEMARDPAIQAALDETVQGLRARGFLPSSGLILRRWVVALAALALLWGTAGLKIAIALGRGRSNFLFLIALAILAGFLVMAVAQPRRNRAGTRHLRELEGHFAGLKGRASSLVPNAATNELVFLAAVFGLSALPAAASARLAPLKLREAGSGGCGSGCAVTSSDGGSSCGGGGGGCGGGGCGGCGS